MSNIIDRRLNDRNKNAVNRERFIRRYKEHVKGAVADMVARRSIRDMADGGDVTVPSKDIAEPTFRHGPGGQRETVHPGNRKFNPGDRIERQKDDDAGSGEGGGGGEGVDGFHFALTREEFLNLFFEDLELPRLERTVLGGLKDRRMQRAGYTTTGAPTNLSIARSLKIAIGRRLALTAPLYREIGERRSDLQSLDVDHDQPCETEQTLLTEIARLQHRIDRVPFIDPIDLRYRHRVLVPHPISQAVMFCLMDVSASMDEHKKDLAKRFYTLLYLFLTRKYEKVDVVFIRHTEDAQEVDEERFFHDPASGGTVVLSALELMNEIIAERYPVGAWNIYGAQVSDGDAFGADPEKSRGFLEDSILPLARYYAYIEVAQSDARVSTLSASYRRVSAAHFAMCEVHERREIYPVFRELFRKEA